MKRFAQLLDALIFTPARNGKLALIEDYVRHAPDPDRGYAIAALTGDLRFARAKPALIRGLAEQRVDAELFGWSYDYVGDLAETVALIWPGTPHGTPPTLSEVVQGLAGGERSVLPLRASAHGRRCRSVLAQLASA